MKISVTGNPLQYEFDTPNTENIEAQHQIDSHLGRRRCKERGRDRRRVGICVGQPYMQSGNSASFRLIADGQEG